MSALVPAASKCPPIAPDQHAKAGMQYWMAFANNGRRVRPGHRVSIEIGNFRAINLVKSVVASPKLDDTLFMAPESQCEIGFGAKACSERSCQQTAERSPRALQLREGCT